jgi:hypothetical protein
MTPLTFAPASSSDVNSSARRERTRADTAENLLLAAALLLEVDRQSAESYAAQAVEMLRAFKNRTAYPPEPAS